MPSERVDRVLSERNFDLVERLTAWAGARATILSWPRLAGGPLPMGSDRRGHVGRAGAGQRAAGAWVLDADGVTRGRHPGRGVTTPATPGAGAALLLPYCSAGASTRRGGRRRLNPQRTGRVSPQTGGRRSPQGLHTGCASLPCRPWVRHPSQPRRRTRTPRTEPQDGRLTAARTRARWSALLTLNGAATCPRPGTSPAGGRLLRSLCVHFDDLEALFVAAAGRHTDRLASWWAHW
jgi:hypothetical protein